MSFERVPCEREDRTILRYCRNPFSSFQSGCPVLTLHPMFETIVAEIATAADKLTHLRRFL
jgi:hypothetical protein